MPSTTPSLDPDRHTGFQLPATESVSHRIHPPAGARTASPTRRFPPRTAGRGPGPPLRQRPDRDPPTHPPEPPRRCRPGKTHPGAVTSSSRSPAVPVPRPALRLPPMCLPGLRAPGRAGRRPAEPGQPEEEPGGGCPPPAAPLLSAAGPGRSRSPRRTPSAPAFQRGPRAPSQGFKMLATKKGKGGKAVRVAFYLFSARLA